MAHAVMEPSPAYIATVIAVAPPPLKDETAAALEALSARSALRTLLFVPGDQHEPPIDTRDHATVIDGLVPRYLNNAVASLRLSSLPSLAWWRGGPVEVLADLAGLVDRLVLDSADPMDGWRHAVSLFERAAITDLRWTRLTRWRSLMAQFFDVRDVTAEASSFTHLEVTAGDAAIADLFAAWITTTLPGGAQINVTHTESPPGHPMQAITLTGRSQTLRLALLPSGTCVRTAIERSGGPLTERVVPMGDQSWPSLLAEELRVRSRDRAFERALQQVVPQ